jgi:hypothetical protein
LEGRAQEGRQQRKREKNGENIIINSYPNYASFMNNPTESKETVSI